MMEIVLTPKLLGPPISGVLGLSLFSLMTNLHLHIILNKLRFDQIGCSGRSGTRSQYGVPKWYEIVKRLGTPALKQSQNIR